jgi:hypothetical protein
VSVRLYLSRLHPAHHADRVVDSVLLFLIRASFCEPES